MKPQSQRAVLSKLKRKLDARTRGTGVAGAFLGRWLDRVWGTGHQMSLSLLLLGLVIGIYSVWRFLLREAP